MRQVRYGMWLAVLVALIAPIALTGGAQSADVKADDDRANSLTPR